MNRIALLQMTSGIDPRVNAAQVAEAVRDAKAGGATMLFTPEMTGLIDRDRERAASNVFREHDDPTLAAAQNAAKEYGVWIHIGSLAIRNVTTNQRLANRSFLIDDQGCVRGRYDKVHLFDVDLPNGESWHESSAYCAGHDLQLARTPIGKIGFSICYDVRFPALYQQLSGAGADILTVPAAFTVPTGEAHWHLLLRARAVENACWVVAAAQVGTHEDGRKTFGHSLVINPWGEIALDMADRPGLAFADINPAMTADVRQRIPVLQHRRSFGEVIQV